MPWDSRHEGATTTYRFRLAHPLLNALVGALTFAFFAVAGVGLVAVGAEDLTVSCARDPHDPAAVCKVDDGFALGRLPVTRYAVGATEATAVTTTGPKKQASTRLELVAKSGVLELPALDPGGNAQEKQQLAQALHDYLKGPEATFTMTVRFWKILAWLGAPFLLLALQSLFLLVTGLFGLAAPSLVVDTGKRRLRVRPRRLAQVRELAFADLAAIELSYSLGKALGQLPPGGLRLLERVGQHLHFVLRDGKRVVFLNRWRITREDMQRLRDDVAQRTELDCNRKG